LVVGYRPAIPKLITLSSWVTEFGRCIGHLGGGGDRTRGGRAGILWLHDLVPGSRWTSFVADPERRRILHEDGNPAHRLRVEHDRERLYVELSGEDGKGPWTVLAVDRDTRSYAVAQGETKAIATEAAARALTEQLSG
jgi:hypothetical protein